MNDIPLNVNTVLLILAAILLIFFLIMAMVFVQSRRKEAHPTAVVQPDPPPEGQSLPWALLVDESGVLKDPRYRIKGVSTLIGRTKPDFAEKLEYLTIDSSSVGRRHAIIEYKNHCFWLSDLKSLNGTFLNGKKITKEVRLKHGDTIGIHKFKFGFILPSLSTDEATIFMGRSNIDTKNPVTKEEAATDDQTVVLTAVKPLRTKGRSNPIRTQVEKTAQNFEEAMEEDQTVVLNPIHPSRSEYPEEKPETEFAEDQTVILNPSGQATPDDTTLPIQAQKRKQENRAPLKTHPNSSQSTDGESSPSGSIGNLDDDKTVILTPQKRQFQSPGHSDFEGDAGEQPTIIMQPKNKKRPPDRSDDSM